MRWYLRYSLSYRDLEEMMSERGLSVDHATLARWVVRYGPILHERIRVDGKRTYLYWAIDATADTIDFMLSPFRDTIAARHFLQLPLWRAGRIRPPIINVDGHPAYPPVIAAL